MTAGRAPRVRLLAHAQGGSVALELALGVGVLVLPVAMLVAVLPGMAERTAMARVAAQEAARVAALAQDPEQGRIGGLALGRQVATNHDVPLGDVAVTVEVPVDAAGDPRRGGEVVATVTVAIRLPALPLVGGAQAFTRTVRHRERIDDYRSFG